MAMSYIWSGLVILSFLWGFFHGNLSAVAAAALDGAQSALELSLSMAGILCLWSGVMEILNVCGLSRRIAALFRPLLRRLLAVSMRKNLSLSQRIFCTTPKTVRGRLLTYFSAQAARCGRMEFEVPFNRQQMADYLNLDRSALSKELCKMRDEGLLEFDKNRFVLKQLPE